MPRKLDSVTLPSGFNEQKKPQLFESLSEESLHVLLGHSIMQNFESGRLLVQQGDTPEYVYLVIEGAVKTSRMSEEGGEATIRMLQPGETCMEAVMFMGGPSPINVQVIENSKILMIPGKIIRTRALEDSQFAVNLLRIVTRHYKNAMHQIDAMNIKAPLQRVGYYFLLKHIEQGPENLEFKLPFRKQVIANYLGMTPETFSRTLKQMQALGINVDDDTIRMRDSFALCHFCDFDADSICTRADKESCEKCRMH